MASGGAAGAAKRQDVAAAVAQRLLEMQGVTRQMSFYNILATAKARNLSEPSAHRSVPHAFSREHMHCGRPALGRLCATPILTAELSDALC